MITPEILINNDIPYVQEEEDAIKFFEFLDSNFKDLLRGILSKGILINGKDCTAKEYLNSTDRSAYSAAIAMTYGGQYVMWMIGMYRDINNALGKTLREDTHVLDKLVDYVKRWFGCDRDYAIAATSRLIRLYTVCSVYVNEEYLNVNTGIESVDSLFKNLKDVWQLWCRQLMYYGALHTGVLIEMLYDGEVEFEISGYQIFLAIFGVVTRSDDTALLDNLEFRLNKVHKIQDWLSNFGDGVKYFSLACCVTTFFFIYKFIDVKKVDDDTVEILNIATTFVETYNEEIHENILDKHWMDVFDEEDSEE